MLKTDSVNLDLIIQQQADMSQVLCNNPKTLKEFLKDKLYEAEKAYHKVWGGENSPNIPLNAKLNPAPEDAEHTSDLGRAYREVLEAREELKDSLKHASSEKEGKFHDICRGAMQAAKGIDAEPQR